MVEPEKKSVLGLTVARRRPSVVVASSEKFENPIWRVCVQEEACEVLGDTYRKVAVWPHVSEHTNGVAFALTGVGIKAKMDERDVRWVSSEKSGGATNAIEVV